LPANNGKAGVFGANGVLNMGGGTLSADTTLPSAAAIAMCFGRVPEKQNRYALQSFGPLSEANPRNSVRLSTAPKETASSGRNDRQNQTGPKNADRCQDQKPIATKPMHARIIPKQCQMAGD